MVGTACLFIAAKQEEETFPGLTAFSEIANNSFTPHDLARLEVRILITLEHRIASPTPRVFLSYLVHGLGLNRKAAALASYLLVSALRGFADIRLEMRRQPPRAVDEPSV